MRISDWSSDVCSSDLLLAAAREGEIDFNIGDIDRLSRKVPNLCKVAPSSHFHLEDVHRAGGVMAILGELERASLRDTSGPTVHTPSLGEAQIGRASCRERECMYV